MVLAFQLACRVVNNWTLQLVPDFLSPVLAGLAGDLTRRRDGPLGVAASFAFTAACNNT